MRAQRRAENLRQGKVKFDSQFEANDELPLIIDALIACDNPTRN